MRVRLLQTNKLNISTRPAFVGKHVAGLSSQTHIATPNDDCNKLIIENEKYKIKSIV